MSEPERRAAPWRAFVRLLWQSPLIAAPFAILFGTLAGAHLHAYQGAYIASLFFAYAISLAFWALEHFIRPHLPFAGDDTTGKGMVWEIAIYVVTSLAGSYAAALAIRLTIAPQFLGSAQNVLIVGMFTLLFTALFIGLISANFYYRRALDRAKSEEELNVARRIQRSFLLTEFPRRTWLEVHAVNLSSKQVSGDFYDVMTPNPTEVLLAIADVSGKGVPAALLSSMLQASLRTQARTLVSPSAMMSTINALACQRTNTGQFATFFLAAVDEGSLTLRFTNAGHNFPVLMRADGTRVLLERGGLVVGMLEDRPYEEGSIALRPGDRIVLYTDGVTEAARPDGEMFGEERLYALLDAQPPELPAAELVERVLAGVRVFLDGIEAGDDITVMALRILDPAHATGEVSPA